MLVIPHFILGVIHDINTMTKHVLSSRNYSCASTLLPPQITTCLEWKRKRRSALPVYISHPPREKLTVHSLPNHVIALPSRGTTPMGVRRYIYTHAEYKRKQRRQHKRAIESQSHILRIISTKVEPHSQETTCIESASTQPLGFIIPIQGRAT